MPASACDAVCDKNVTNACGNWIDCPATCNLAEQCTNNVCVCPPVNQADCASSGFVCDDFANACGNKISCGQCSPDAYCQLHQCICPPLDPGLCNATAACGLFQNRCGETLRCRNNCTLPEVCVRNRCLAPSEVAPVPAESSGLIPSEVAGFDTLYVLIVVAGVLCLLIGVVAAVIVMRRRSSGDSSSVQLDDINVSATMSELPSPGMMTPEQNYGHASLVGDYATLPSVSGSPSADTYESLPNPGLSPADNYGQIGGADTYGKLPSPASDYGSLEDQYGTMPTPPVEAAYSGIPGNGS
jgi:hypothetical protein